MNFTAHKINKLNNLPILLRVKRIFRLLSSFLAVTIVVLIKLYQRFLSPMLGGSCRFYPTCSNYALQSFQKYGLLSGSILTIKRLCKCHPFHSGGLDEVPLKNVNPQCKELN